jgi:oxalate decarboxylase/phosphoglucose isomerase-like protein (cupin superfamily)
VNFPVALALVRVLTAALHLDDFPYLTGFGVSGAVSFVAPCGLNIPHMHPRADEFFTVVEGQLETGWVMENGFSQEVSAPLGKYQGTVFPMGSIHYQQNPTCDQAVFVAGFNNNDPGRSDIITNYFMFDDDIIAASLAPTQINASTIDQWRSQLPVNLAAGVDSCLQACGLSTS